MLSENQELKVHLAFLKGGLFRLFLNKHSMLSKIKKKMKFFIREYISVLKESKSKKIWKKYKKNNFIFWTQKQQN